MGHTTHVLFQLVNMNICVKEVLMIETKTILVFVLCMVIIGGAVYLRIRKKVRKRQQEDE